MITGKNFRIDGDKLSIFDVTVQRLPGDNWILTSLSGNVRGAESPVADIDLMGRLDKVDGAVSAIVISAQVACELWLANVVGNSHLENAIEKQCQGNSAIQLSDVSMGCYVVPSVIICDGLGARIIKLIV